MVIHSADRIAVEVKGPIGTVNDRRLPDLFALGEGFYCLGDPAGFLGACGTGESKACGNDQNCDRIANHFAHDLLYS